MKKVEKVDITETVKKAASLPLFQQVKTPHGIGILIGVETPGNGLYYEPERARYLVWYGVEDERTEWTGGQDPDIHISKYVAFNYTLDELEPRHVLVSG